MQHQLSSFKAWASRGKSWHQHPLPVYRVKREQSKTSKVAIADAWTVNLYKKTNVLSDKILRIFSKANNCMSTSTQRCKRIYNCTKENQLSQWSTYFFVPEYLLIVCALFKGNSGPSDNINSVTYIIMFFILHDKNDDIPVKRDRWSALTNQANRRNHGRPLANQAMAPSQGLIPNT